jgi:hypothetical protein
MNKPNVSREAMEDATWSVVVLLDAMRERMKELKIIWRRQRTDVDTQVRYYSNGLLQNYYRVRCFPFVMFGAENCSYLVRNSARLSLTQTWRISKMRANGILRTNGRRRMSRRMLTSRTTRQALQS